jgi:lipopolysaccharide cholinephosphotransferase
MVLSSEDLRKLQLVQLKILKEVHGMCEKHNIQYFLTCGTLIGAVRHKGFIPWDDDIDIGMLREEYDKFCTVCKTELSDDYFLQTIETDPGYGNAFGKFMLKKTLFISKMSGKAKKKSGIPIDIFPYDCIPNGKYRQSIQRKIVNTLRMAYLVKKKYLVMGNYPKLKRMLYCSCYRMLSFLPSSLIRHLLYNTIIKYSYLGKNKNCLVTIFGLSHFKGITEINNLRNLTLVPFEDGTFYIPKEYDTILSKLYGDYMTFPPPDKRVSKHELIALDFNCS